MIHFKEFLYKPSENECEYASSSYLMSLVAVIAGLPIPIFNLIATVVFYLGNRKGTYFTRWHCTQALISQFSLFFLNSFAFWWTIYIILDKKTIDNYYFAYIFTILIVNFTEVVATIITSIQTRKGIHVEWWFYGAITNKICKP